MFCSERDIVICSCWKGNCSSSLFRLAMCVIHVLILSIIPRCGSFGMMKTLVRVPFSTDKALEASRSLSMGLYDEPIAPPPPSPPPNDGKRRGEKLPRNISDGEDEKFSSSNAELSEDAYNRPILFQFDENGNENGNILPSLNRRMDIGVPCYYEATDSLVRSILRMTRCNPVDACWALEAHKGNVMEASLSIALAQRNALNESVELPGLDEVKDVDWDEELKNLGKGGGGGSGKAGLGGEEFENEGRSLGLDGLEERKKWLEEKARRDGLKRLFSTGKKDAKWVPGNSDARPVKDEDSWEDEPWFTG